MRLSDAQNTGPRGSFVLCYFCDSLHRYDLEDAFGKCGPVKSVWVARRPPGFGFVEMEAREDAEEAVGKTIGKEIVDLFWPKAQGKFMLPGEVVGWDQGSRNKDQSAVSCN